jgi:hypothetical protein
MGCRASLRSRDAGRICRSVGWLHSRARSATVDRTGPLTRGGGDFGAAGTDERLVCVRSIVGGSGPPSGIDGACLELAPAPRDRDDPQGLRERTLSRWSATPLSRGIAGGAVDAPGTASPPWPTAAPAAQHDRRRPSGSPGWVALERRVRRPSATGVLRVRPRRRPRWAPATARLAPPEPRVL